MSDPDLQETIRALENYLDPNCHIFDMTNVRNAITLLKAQQELEELSSVCPDCGCRSYIPRQESSDE